MDETDSTEYIKDTLFRTDKSQDQEKNTPSERFKRDIDLNDIINVLSSRKYPISIGTLSGYEQYTSIMKVDNTPSSTQLFESLFGREFGEPGIEFNNYIRKIAISSTIIGYQTAERKYQHHIELLTNNILNLQQENARLNNLIKSEFKLPESFFDEDFDEE